MNFCKGVISSVDWHKLRIAVALAKREPRGIFVSLYLEPSLLIVMGLILLFCLFKDFKYSIPKILLGEESTLANLRISFNYIITAFSRALGKDSPLANS